MNLPDGCSMNDLPGWNAKTCPKCDFEYEGECCDCGYEEEADCDGPDEPDEIDNTGHGYEP